MTFILFRERVNSLKVQLDSDKDGSTKVRRVFDLFRRVRVPRVIVYHNHLILRIQPARSRKKVIVAIVLELE